LTGTGVSGTALPNVTLLAETPEDKFGWSVNCSGNVNGDSYDDVVIGAPYYDSSRGRAYVFLCNDSLATTIPAFNANVTLNGASIGDKFGYSVGGADLGADGFSDILVGAPYNDTIDGSITDAGATYVFNGSVSMSEIMDAENCTRYGENEDDHFGWSVSPARDVNYDHYDDIIVGAPHYDNGTDIDAGKAYILTTQKVTVIPELSTAVLPAIIGILVLTVWRSILKRRKRKKRK
jgi:hypothetical protein